MWAKTHQERCADPGEGPHGVQVGRFFQHLQLLLPDGQHLVLERQLPGVKLEHFDPVENFIHQFNPIVLTLHVGYLQREEQSAPQVGAGTLTSGLGIGPSLNIPIHQKWAFLRV